MSDNVLIICIDEKTSDSLDLIEQEAVGLCSALNLNIIDLKTLNIKVINPSTFISKGHLEDIKACVEEHKIDLVYVDTHIKPGQQRDLEKFLGTKVIDRTAIILEIFADRAKTQEGRIQVDLAYKTYQKSRVVRAWSHLERQRGGSSFIGGPGEKQTELDRRALDNEIKTLEKDLIKIKQNRALQRQARQKEDFPIIALVGYTNAGKSTLFNKLTQANVIAKDMLFATLDPTMRALQLPNSQKAILSDTVGFIRNLPTELVAAFSATLEEVVEADIILHVHDISSENMNTQAQTVRETLEDLGIDYDSDHIIQVYNKIDLVDNEQINQQQSLKGRAVISAVTGFGIDNLYQVIIDNLMTGKKDYTFSISIEDGKSIAWLHAHSRVISIDYTLDKAIITTTMGEPAFQKFMKIWPQHTIAMQK